MHTENIYPGLYRGLVYDARDPLSRGRLRLRIPQLFGKDIAEWAWPVQPVSAEFTLPEVGQGVWVAFEGGDPSFPIWLGTFEVKDVSPTKVAINSPTPSQLAEAFISESPSDTLNLVSTLVAISQELENLQSQITSQGSDITSIQGDISSLDARVTALEP